MPPSIHEAGDCPIFLEFYLRVRRAFRPYFILFIRDFFDSVEKIGKTFHILWIFFPFLIFLKMMGVWGKPELSLCYSILQCLTLFGTNFADFNTNGCFSVGRICRLPIVKVFQKIFFWAVNWSLFPSENKVKRSNDDCIWILSMWQNRATPFIWDTAREKDKSRKNKRWIYYELGDKDFRQ